MILRFLEIVLLYNKFMNEIYSQIEKWFAEGKQVALATVLKTWGSSPRDVGSKMAISDLGEMTGSVSGGCVETAVITESEEVLKTKKAKRLHYGVTDELATEVGLACGGKVDILLQPLDKAWFKTWRQNHDDKKSILTSISLEESSKNFGKVLMVDTDEKQVVYDSIVDKKQGFAFGLIGKAPTDIQVFSDNDEMIYYMEPMRYPDRLCIVGGAHVSQYLVKFGNLMGYETIVIDPRKKFLEGERFADANQVRQEWADTALEDIAIDASTAIVFLTHDPKIDDPGLEVALKSKASYIGTLGSRRTQSARKERMLEKGITKLEYARVFGPIGLNIGSKTPDEIALSIISEIIKVKNNVV